MSSGASLLRFATLLLALAGCSEARSSADLGSGGNGGAPPEGDAAPDVVAEAEPGDAITPDADASDAPGEASPDVVVTGPCGQTPVERALIEVAAQVTESAAQARLELVRACAGIADDLDLEPRWTCCEPPSDSLLLSTCKLASHAIRTELASEPGTEVAIPALPCSPGQAASSACRFACGGDQCDLLCAVLDSTQASCPTPTVSVGATSMRFRDTLVAHGAALVRVNAWLSGAQSFPPAHVATDAAAAEMAAARRVCTDRVGELAQAALSFGAARSASAEVLAYLGIPLPR
jgi:hypothetical protein